MKDADRVLDRVVRFDERSRGYGIRAIMKKGAVPRSYTWACKLWLDQGVDGACTGFSVCHEAAARPVEVKGLNAKVAEAVYHRARELDEWEGEDYEGSSVLGAIKAGAERHWYDEYRWAFGEDDLMLAVGHHGPAVLGINWYESMFEPSAHGVLRVGGEIAGGHAILCNGFNVKTGMYRLHNSWGKSWGIDGEAFVSRKDMARLLKEQGEACIPVKRSKGSLTPVP